MKVIFQFPPIFALYKRSKGNIIRQLILPSYSSEVVVERYTENRIKGYVITPASKGRIRKVLASWRRAFTYRKEDIERNTVGLRSPQIGAVHAVHAHWATSDEVATVVMPTGTGKTEVMLSVLISSQYERLLVVVPTDALRSQIGDKFLTLGILKDAGVVAKRALYPIVGTLKHKPKSEGEN